MIKASLISTFKPCNLISGHFNALYYITSQVWTLLICTAHIGDYVTGPKKKINCVLTGLVGRVIRLLSSVSDCGPNIGYRTCTSSLMGSAESVWPQPHWIKSLTSLPCHYSVYKTVTEGSWEGGVSLYPVSRPSKLHYLRPLNLFASSRTSRFDRNATGTCQSWWDGRRYRRINAGPQLRMAAAGPGRPPLNPA